MFLVGVDEAGRGPLAGPVAVGVVVVSEDLDWDLVPGVGDSKQVSPKNREAIFRRAKELKRSGVLDFAVAMVGAKEIDKIGIARAIATAMVRAMRRLPLDPSRDNILLDGALKAPTEFKYQKTIIKGDGSEPVIGLASILAKVTRDRYMVRMSSTFAPYDFHIHKGYGTKAHCTAIKKHGLSEIHRHTFCNRFK